MNKSVPCDQQAFPHSKSTRDPWGNLSVEATMGLTKRELFAAMAMQGFAADPNEGHIGVFATKAEAEAARMERIAGCARTAVEWADALLTALKETQA